MSEIDPEKWKKFIDDEGDYSIGAGNPEHFTPTATTKHDELVEEIKKIIPIYNSRHYGEAPVLSDATIQLIIALIRRDESPELIEDIIGALKQLVDLKDYKDRFGKTETYLELQPKAWARARELLKSKL